MWRISHPVIWVAALLSLSSVAVAQVIPPSERPGREQERFSEPLAPQARPGGQAIALPSTVAPAGAAKVSILLRTVKITGSSVYRADDLQPLYQELLGHRISLQAIYDLAQRITAKYGADGYVLSRAIVPPQQLHPGGADIRIEIVEGYVDRVVWPASLARYRDFFTDYAARITAERPANIRTIERYMLLAGDLPGLKFATSLKASTAHAAASTLYVEVTTKPVEGFARLDNRGTKARGPIQYLASATLNNLFGVHDALTLSWAGTAPLRELQYFAANYRQVLTSEGLTFFADGSVNGGRPGTLALETLDFRTRGNAFDIGLAYPVIRSRERNLTVSGLFFTSDNFSDTLGAPFNRDKLRGFRGRVDADFADRFGGINQINMIYSQGINGLGSSSNGNLLASRLVGRVDFSKIEGSISRTQALFGPVSAFVAAYGQYGFNPLLTPEQCGYGGRFFGRAFDPSQLLGDSCIEALGELRWDLPTAAVPGSQAQLYGFADWGQLKTRDPAFGTPGFVEAASVGAGVRLGYFDYAKLDLQAAKGVQGPREDWRFFFALTSKY